MNLNNQADAQITQIVKQWDEIHAETDDLKLAGKYIQNSPIYNEIARLNNQVIIISNYKKHQFLSLSDNFNDIYEYGISKTECMRWGAFYFFRCLPFDQIRASMAIGSWFKSRIKQQIDSPLYRQSYCSWKFKSLSTGKTKYLMGNSQGLEYSEKGEPLIVMTTVRDVTHLLKDNPPMWSRIQYENGENSHFTYQIDKKGISHSDIITARELEFLKTFEIGLDLKDIAEQMNISYKTADTHKINILNRLGARNPMAALELLKLIGMI
jgi:DNA-binding CsgD family transcriptional regulator